MISTDGQTYIKRYLAGQTPAIAQCIAFGIGDAAVSTTDNSLQLEVGRADVVLTSYDFVNDKIIFKAVLPDDFDGTIYEAALYSMRENPVAGNYASKLLVSFDSQSEVWTTGGAASTFTTTANRLAGDSLTQTPAASTSQVDSLDNVLIDLSGNSSADTFVFAVNVGANVASIEYAFMTDAANYFTYTFTPAAGYQFITANKGSASVAGAPDWGNITSIQVTTTATSAGAASVNFDAARIEDTDSINPEYVMVARDVLATPFTKVDGQTQEIEFPLSVSVA